MAAAGVGWFDWDPRVDHLVFDERACRLFGIDPDAFDHKVATFWARLHPEDVARRRGSGGAGAGDLR